MTLNAKTMIETCVVFLVLGFSLLGMINIEVPFCAHDQSDPAGVFRSACN